MNKIIQIKNLLGLLCLCLSIASPLKAQDILFYDGFEITGQLDTNYWTARPNLFGSNGIVGITQAAAIGNYAVRLGKSTDGGFTTNALDLKLDISGEDQLALVFAIYNVDDETHNTNQALYNDGIFFSSDGGVNFYKVYEFDPDNWCLGYGILPPIDIDKIINEHPNLTFSTEFVIRFQQYDDENFSNSSSQDGFHLDNITVYDPEILYASIPFFDNFDVATNLGPQWQWGDPSLTAPISSRTTNGSYGRTLGGSNYRVQMGKRCDGGSFAQNFHTNAFDLHLNLLGATQLALEFDLYDNDDEAQPFDGIWFSDDGGENFTKMYQFNFERWCSYAYGKLPPIDIDDFVNADPNLSFTSTCVIRFQQYGDQDFSNSSSQDGIYLDNVHVYDPSIEYIDEFPFLDDFESNIGLLGKMWAWSPAYQTSDSLTITGNGSFGLGSSSGMFNSYGLFMGKRCDGTFHTNALDLHANFSNTDNKVFSFYLYNLGNEPHIEDGIWVSVDGGLNFTQIDTFDFTQLTPYSFTKYSLKLDSALSAHNLATSSTATIIRIQQYDDENFSNSNSWDGFRIDSVQIIADQTTALDQSLADQIEISPNPTHDWIHINKANHDGKALNLKLYSLTGELILQRALFSNNESINIQAFVPGIYLIQIEQNGRQMTQKIIKQ